ncbi:MAG TPA: hypothetical protein VEX60_01445, partial [Pyrinomonadaceae bacterium]|nr:hypothetical protein [Pyrinomonadaceae bacterium]
MNKRQILSSYAWIIIAAGAVTVAYCILTVPFAQLDLKFALLAALTIFISSRFVISIPNYSGHITISDTFIFLIMLFYGGEAAVFVAAAEGTYGSIPYRQKHRTVAFNASEMAISTFLSATAVEFFFGQLTLLPRTDNLGSFLAAVCVMAIVQYAANSCLASIFTALRRDQGIIHTWSRYYLWSSITYLAGASAAGIISRLVVAFGFYYVLLVTPIIFIIYLTYKTYLKNVEASAVQAEQAERDRMREQYTQMEKLSALGELASGVAHNFNNTLTGILARAQLLSEAKDPNEIKRGLRIIIQTAEDGAKTVKRI